MGWLDFLSLLYALTLAYAAGYGIARSRLQRQVNEELERRAPLIEKARLEEQERTEQARRQADEARRHADAATAALENARREAALDAREAAAQAVEAAAVQARQETRRELEAQHAEREAQLVARESAAVELVSLRDQAAAKLEQVAGLTRQEASARVREEVTTEARRAAAREALQIEQAAREEAEKRATRILSVAVQRYAGEHVQERAVTTVHLPSDDMKGRLIGREGRNIRALQDACGVDFIIDDTPEVVVISGFDPVRREVARITVEQLVADGRIQPTRIEEVVTQARKQVEDGLSTHGESALLELGLGTAQPEILRLLGGLRYRHSHGQNVLRHSIEVGYLTGLMAGELGLDVKVARRAGLLHDIGKAVSHEQEGGHAVVGGRYARKHGEDAVVANAIAGHHDDEPAQSPIVHLVAAADALSSARPGARRDELESYVKRLQDLERIATRFAGVERAYAIQAGREIRVIVEPSEVLDEEAALLAREIARRIEEELAYPGQVRVTVIREVRAVDYAR